MPAGCACRSLPFGPCTFDGAVDHLDGDALGNGMGFFPIRDISLSLKLLSSQLSRLQPSLSWQLELERYHMLQSTSPPTPAFTAARPVITPRDVVRMLVPSPAEHLRHVVAAEIDAAAGPADALDPGDQPLAVRPVLEEQAQRLGLRASSSRRRRPAA